MAGRAWNSHEEARLIDELADGVKIEQIALNHDRSSGAINSRRRKLAGVYYEDGMSIPEIQKKLRMKYEEINRALQRRELLRKHKDVGVQTDASPLLDSGV